MPTQERLKEVLNYDPETGVFTYRIRRSKMLPGSVAGCHNNYGYLAICIDSKLMVAHRLAWLYVHGELPNGQIDHVNGVRDDNRMSNLRLATVSQNAQNMRRAKANNKAGALGVHFDKRRGKWRACIDHKHIGYYDTLNLASAAYAREKQVRHPYSTLHFSQVLTPAG